MRRDICFAIIISMFLVGCNSESSINSSSNELDVKDSSSKENEDIDQADNQLPSEDEPSGIMVSDWYMSEKYGRDIIDILNFDDRARRILVNSVCFDSENSIIPFDDTELLEMPPRSQWAWIPLCPNGTASYNINITELD